MARASTRPIPPHAIPRLSSLAGLARIDGWTAATLVMSAAAAACFVAVSTLRWRHFETNAFDLAFFDQIIWNTSEGRWLESSFIPYNFTGQHVEPILLPFALAYWLFDAGPVFLMTTQGIVVAFAALPLYAAARRFRLPAPVAVALAAAYLLNPYLHRTVQFDFHPEVMAAFPAFASAWAVAARRYRVASVLAVSLLLFKEDAVFMTLALAGLLWLEGARRQAALTATISIAYTALVVLILMPQVRDGVPGDLVQRYGYLVDASDQFDLLPGLASQPWVIIQHLAGVDRIWTMFLFAMVSAPLALFRPWLLIPLVPGMALAVLATHPAQRRLELHYTAELVPVALIISMVAARRVLAGRPGKLGMPSVAGSLLIPAVAGFFILSPLSPLEDRPTPPSLSHRQALDEAVALVPPGAPVSAQSHVLPRLSQREEAFEFPFRYELVQWVVVDRYGHRSSQSLGSGFDESMQLVRETFDRLYDKDGVEVFRSRQ